jgi:hypothetical protein
MAHAVKYQIETCTDWSEGEVILANHPGAGGSHLPDFTVITPVGFFFVFRKQNWLEGSATSSGFGIAIIFLNFWEFRFLNIPT